MVTRRTPTRFALVFTASPLLMGCAARDNDRLTLGGVGTGEPLALVQPQPPLGESAGGTVVSADRSGWPETAVRVPMDRVDAPACGSMLAGRAAGTRHGGRFPTPEESVELRADGGAWIGPRGWVRAPVPTLDAAPHAEQPK